MGKALDPLKKFRLVHSFIRGFLWIRNFSRVLPVQSRFPFKSSALRSELLLGPVTVTDHELVCVGFIFPLPFHDLEA